MHTDEGLAALALANEIELWTRSTTLVPGGAQGREGPVLWISSGIAAAFANQVLVDREGADAASIERAVAELRRRGHPFEVRIRRGPDERLVPAIEALGLREDADQASPAMAFEPIDAANAPAPEGLDIRPVVDADGLAAHVQVVSEAFGLPVELARRLFPLEGLAVPGFTAFVGHHEGRPVASSFAFTAREVVGVYNVGTLEPVRRRGFAAAMTARAIADGAARGATVATLQTSDMGRGVYEAMGFRVVQEFRVFVEPGAED